jgi:hypothetical protein
MRLLFLIDSQIVFGGGGGGAGSSFLPLPHYLGFMY